MKTIFTDNCPICQTKLHDYPDEFGTLYNCAGHYTYEKKNNTDYNLVDFMIPRYMVRTYISEQTYRIYKRDEQNQLYNMVAVFPAFEFDWNNLQALSDKFKNLIIFT